MGLSRMEDVARHRLSILSSHIDPRPQYVSPSSVAASSCASSHANLEKGENGTDGCVFCKIIRGEAPASKVYEDDTCMCILDTYPLCCGHSLIIPKRHYPSLDATPPSIIGAMCSKVPLIGNAIMKATGCDSFNLLINNGVAAGQVIHHTHIHIIPRKKQDCLWTSESLCRRRLQLDQETSRLASCIRENLSFEGEECEDGKGRAQAPGFFGS